MSDHKIKVDVELDTSKAKKQLDDLTKQKQKVKIDVDASKLKAASKEIEDIGKNNNQKYLKRGSFLKYLNAIIKNPP